MIKETIHEKVKIHNNFNFFSFVMGNLDILGCYAHFNSIMFTIPRNDMDNSSVATS